VLAGNTRAWTKRSFCAAFSKLRLLGSGDGRRRRGDAASASPSSFVTDEVHIEPRNRLDGIRHVRRDDISLQPSYIGGE